jgi:hypothetical protein
MTSVLFNGHHAIESPAAPFTKHTHHIYITKATLCFLERRARNCFIDFQSKFFNWFSLPKRNDIQIWHFLYDFHLNSTFNIKSTDQASATPLNNDIHANFNSFSYSVVEGELSHLRFCWAPGSCPCLLFGVSVARNNEHTHDSDNNNADVVKNHVKASNIDWNSTALLVLLNFCFFYL